MTTRRLIGETGRMLVALLFSAGVLLAGDRSGSPAAHRRPAGPRQEIAGAGAMNHSQRWREKEERGQLPAGMTRVLRHEERKQSAGALRRGRRPWERMIPAKPRVLRPEGLPQSTSSTVDSVLASWVNHYSSGLAPSTDAAVVVTCDAAGNVYVAGYTTGIFTGSDYLTIKYNSAGVQQWVATYSGPGNDYDAASSIGVDGAGNVYVTGSSFGVNTEEDYATIKYSPAGQELWVARYDGTGNDYDAASALKVDNGGNVVVTGVSQGVTSDGDYVTIKYTSTGTEFWVRRYDGTGNDFDIPAGLGIDLSGSIYVSGTSIGLDSYEDFVTIKYSFAGDQVWVARYDGPGNDYDAVASIAVDIAGNSYVTGTSYNINFDADITTIKYDTFGSADWTSRYNSPEESDEIPSALVIDASRNVYVTGNSYGFGTGEDYLTIKYSTNGGIRWVARYNGSGNAYDIASAIAVDPAGSVFVTGLSTGLGTLEDLVTVKYSSLGVQLWTQRYVGPANDYDAGTSIAIDGSGNVLACGSSYGEVTDEDALVTKYNTSGVPQWAGRYNGPGNSADEAAGVALDAAGNIYVTGTSYDLQNQSDYATVKYNAAGVQQWVARYNGTGEGEDFASALTVDASGNVYVTGTSYDLVTGYDIVTVKYNTNGVLIWTARYASPGAAIDEGADIAVDGFGNVHVTGSRTAAGTGVDYVTVKYLAAGGQSWVATYNGESDSTDEAYDLALDLAGSVYVTGASYRSGTDFDILTIKYNGSGAQQWTARYNGPGNSEDRGFALVIDGSNVVVTGIARSTATGSDIVTVRYSSTGAQQWARNYNSAGTEDDIPTALVLGSGGILYVAGTSHSALTGYDFVILKYNSAGTQQWLSTYNSAEGDDDVVTALTLDAAGSIYASGYSFMLFSGYDYATVKVNSSGVRQWLSRYDDPAQFNDEPRGVAVDAGGNVYVAGYSETEDGSVYSLVKYEAPLLSFNRSAITFPSVQSGCRRDDTLIVRNPSGTNALAVFSIASTDQNFTVSPSSFLVPAGDSVKVGVRFAPLGPGAKAGTLVVTHNAMSTPDSVTLSGTGTGSAGAILVTATLVEGWRLYALPVTVVCPMVIPYSYAFAGGYYRSDTLVSGRGYWTKLLDPTMHFTGFPITADSIPVLQGWNLIGGISVPVRVAGVTSIPDSIVRTAFFGYAGSYSVADSVRPARGYWVKVAQSGQIIFRQGAGPDLPPPVPAIPDDAGRLLISDAGGSSQTLYYVVGGSQAGLRDFYELPPPPPEGVFDARFSSDRMVEVVDDAADRPLTVSARRFPVTISWSAGPAAADAFLVVGKREISLRQSGSITLESAGIAVALRTGAGETTPAAFTLRQNYPNPFNPSTEISFSLPARSAVTLRLFDVLGREVHTLFAGIADAGTRTVRWDGRDGRGMGVAGGVYFYRLEGTDLAEPGRTYSETRKMLLLK